MESAKQNKAGRKANPESRAAELRERLIAWNQCPTSTRPSLRALACELGTAHQLLQHYLEGLEEWQRKRSYQAAREKADRDAVEIRARAEAENRNMTLHECLDAIVAPALLKKVEGIRQAAKRGPLHRLELKMLRSLASHGVPGAQQALRDCAAAGVKQKKDFAKVVKEVPRKEGESFRDWVRRIWDQCDKYETNSPSVISEELLERYSRRVDTNGEKNLPPSPSRSL